MALVNAATGETVATCTPDEARALTDEIKGATERVWALLLRAHEMHVWDALGFSSWEEYVRAEFDMSRRQAYYLLDQGRVVFAIEEASGVQHVAHELTIRETQDIKPRLKAVTNEIKDRLTAEADAPEPERVKEIVAEVVAEQRAKAQQESEDRTAINETAAAMKSAGFDMDKASLTERGTWSTHCRDLGSTAPVGEFLARHRAHLTQRHIAQAERAYAWLDEFLLDLREAE